MRLLVTRPEPDGERTAAELRARGHEVMLAPLLRVETVTDAELGAGPWAAVLITSANGARAIAAHRRRGELMALPVLAVGAGSATAARDAGFADVTSADGDGGDLARLAAARFAGAAKPLLYLAGEERARDLGGELAASGLKVDDRRGLSHRQGDGVSRTTSGRRCMAGAIDGVLHFSRRSVESYLDCARDMAGPALAARSLLPVGAGGRAAPGRAARGDEIRVRAPGPDEAGLLALVTSPAMKPNRIECSMATGKRPPSGIPGARRQAACADHRPQGDRSRGRARAPPPIAARAGSSRRCAERAAEPPHVPPATSRRTPPQPPPPPSAGGDRLAAARRSLAGGGGRRAGRRRRCCWSCC